VHEERQVGGMRPIHRMIQSGIVISRARVVLALIVASAAGGAMYYASSRGTADRPPAWVEAISDTTRRTRPSLALIVYDTRRWDDFSLGALGNRRRDTAFLDGWSTDAVVFENAVSPGVWTLPVHASMFSGLSICELGVDYYNPGFASFTPKLLSLAEVLRAAGYRAAAFADHPVFLSGDEARSLVRGFETWEVLRSFESFRAVSRRYAGAEVELSSPLAALPGPRRDVLAAAIRDFNAGLRATSGEADEDPLTGVWLPDLRPLYADSGYAEARYGGLFQDFLTRDDPRPLFLFLNLHMVQSAYPAPDLHARWAVEVLIANAERMGRQLLVPESEKAVDEIVDRNFEALGLSYAPFEQPAAYVKHVFDTRFLDATFEAVWRRLEAAGLTRNLVSLVTSDHGLSFGERGELFYRHEGAWPDEYIVRVPILLRLPQGERWGERRGVRRERVSLTDVFATFVQLGLGRGVFERDLPVRGGSLIDRLRADHFEPFLVSESAVMPDGYREWPRVAAYAKAVYEGRWKLVFAPGGFEVLNAEFWPSDVRLGGEPKEGRGVLPEHRRIDVSLVQLFDLEADPAALRDVAGDHPEVVGRLRERIAGSEHCEAALGGDTAAEWDGEALETLRALGYIR